MTHLTREQIEAMPRIAQIIDIVREDIAKDRAAAQMNTHDITAIISQRITDYAEEEARAQRAQARCHEHAMTLTPGTPERNTSNGLVAASLNRKQKARAAYMALIDVAHHTGTMTPYETAAAVKLGKHNAGVSQWEVTIR